MTTTRLTQKPSEAIAIVWFRRDLRLADQPALHAAIERGQSVVPVYIHAPDEEAPWAPGGASKAWLHRSLAALSASLERAGAPLVVRRGPTLKALRALIRETGATSVYFNRRHEPAVRARDAAVIEALQADGIEVETFNASLLVEPDRITNKTGGPYRVFTPFWRAVSARIEPREPWPAPRKIVAGPTVDSLALDALRLKPKLGWDAGFDERWTPGERGAQLRLTRFIDGVLGHYAAMRDRPDVEGTSQLSPHLAFGEIGPNQILWALASRDLLDRGAKFLSELGWREFAAHLLHHFPESTTEPLDARFARFPWQRDDAAFDAWRRGHTGIPIVDAGLRELWHHGVVHNRVRMLVASFLTKNLRHHWLDGARWFWDTLVDADLANNTMGWQWVAGSGADAAPYFRVFNPVTQGEKFDPDGEYVRRWVPELRGIAGGAVHRPWALDRATLAKLELAGTVYADPIVDLAESREAALDAYRAMRGATPG